MAGGLWARGPLANFLIFWMKSGSLVGFRPGPWVFARTDMTLKGIATVLPPRMSSYTLSLGLWIFKQRNCDWLKEKETPEDKINGIIIRENGIVMSKFLLKDPQSFLLRPQYLLDKMFGEFIVTVVP